MAALVYRAAPRRSQNRRLALLLALEGSWLFAEFGLEFLAADAATAYATTGLWGALLVAVPWAYLAFLGTLDTPLAAPLRGRGAVAILAVGAMASAALVVIFPAEFATYGPSAYASFSPFPGPWIGAFNAAVSIVWLYALAVAFSAWRRVPRGSPRKAAAKAYLVAVGFRDAIVTVGAFNLALAIFNSGAAAAASGLFTVSLLSIPVVYLVSEVLLAYGILKTQLFDVDLRLQWTVKQSTVAAAFVAVFFLASEGAQLVLAESVGPLVGLVAAAVLVFALAPLQRAAERVAHTAMPNVRDTAEYRLVRKREVYRAALEGALQDGVVTEKERDILARLQDELGLSATEARALEREATPGTAA
jgi:hypothetical protein